MSDSSRENSIQPEFKKPKIGTEPSSMEFSDLTDDAIGLIIDRLNLKERLILRKVSRGLRTIVDHKKSILKTLSFICKDDNIYVYYNDNLAVYAHPNYDSSQFVKVNGKRRNKLIKDENYMKMALADLQFVFKDRTVQLDELKVEYFPDFEQSKHSDIENFFGELRNILESLNHKISTKSFHTTAYYRHITLAILPYLKPGTLEVINFCDVFYNEAAVNRIVNSDQWKQAKEVSFKNAQHMLAEEHLTHFKRIRMFEELMFSKALLKWRDFFSKSPNFEFAQINTELGVYPVNVQDHLGDIISSKGNYMYIIHHPMANDSNHMLEIDVKAGFSATISFTKIARHSV